MTEAPENTLAAFELALQSPIDGIELDVQLSADGALVIHHDEYTRRVTGERRRIGELTLEALAAADWGAWFSADYHGEPMPTLDAVLSRYAGRTRLLVEIKSFEQDRRSGRIQRLTERVVEAVRAIAAPRDVFLLSFDPQVLAHAHALDDELPCVLNTTDPRGARAGEWSYLFAYSIDIRHLNRDFVSFTREGGKRLMTWSCNSPAQVDKAVDAGADVIMTDRPAWIVPYLSGRHGWTVEP